MVFLVPLEAMNGSPWSKLGYAIVGKITAPKISLISFKRQNRDHRYFQIDGSFSKYLIATGR